MMRRSAKRRQRVSNKVRQYVERARNKLHRRDRENLDVPPGFALCTDSQIQLLLELDQPISRRRTPSLRLFDENDTVRSTKHVYYRTFTPPKECAIPRRPHRASDAKLDGKF